MKKLLLGLTTLLIFFPYLNTQAAEPNLSYYQIRYQIACRDYDTTDARCFWNKVEFVHAKEILGRGDISDYLTTDELERIEKKIGFLETRYEDFCENTDEPSYFCPALSKLVEKGKYFLENEQVYINEPIHYAGENFELAIVVPETNEFSGVAWEYNWLEENACDMNDGYNDAIEQVLVSNDGKNYDIITAECNDKTELDYYFDIDNFFGNLGTEEEEAIEATVEILCSSDMFNCSDYSSQADAQAVFDMCWEYTGIDIHNLDGDGNGIACENLD